MVARGLLADYPPLGNVSQDEIRALLSESADASVLRYVLWRMVCRDELEGCGGDLDNLTTLRELLGEPDGPDRLLAAELARQDGDFKQAIHLLDTSHPLWDLHGVAAGIRQLAIRCERRLGVWDRTRGKWET
jgi:hypothetical protein